MMSKAQPNTTCSTCGKLFHVKQSQKDRFKRTLGYFCSQSCVAEAKRQQYAGERNPNYKGRNTDADGYRLHAPAARRTASGRLMQGKLHQAVACEALGIESVPTGYHVHHRDCDVTNCTPENLAILNISDHKWIHKQFGVATLWAYCHGKIDLESLVSWSDDRERASRVLTLNVLNQANDNFQPTKD